MILANRAQSYWIGVCVCLLVAGVIALSTGARLSPYQSDSGAARYYFKATTTAECRADEALPLPEGPAPGPAPIEPEPARYLPPEVAQTPGVLIENRLRPLRAPPLPA